MDYDYREAMKLVNQLCFPLYAAARNVTGLYTPWLKPLGLTYTQYLTMLVLWEEKQINMKTLGERLYLDSGTLTPVLKRLEEKGYITRARDASDERNLVLHVTDAGERLKDEVYAIHQRMESWSPVSEQDEKVLRRIFLDALARYKEKEQD